MALRVFDVANYFLSRVDEEAGDAITNLHLQKLVYYAQGFSLAFLEYPLFPETIEAWQHGPAIPVLFEKYKEYRCNAIPVPKDFDFAVFSEDEKRLLNEIYEVYGSYSAWRLKEIVLNETPWKEAIAKGARTKISLSAMREYFATQIE